MYREYFGFRENPFSISPDPAYLYMSARHREAQAHLRYGLQSDGGFVLLTGEIGTGKTTLCKSLFNEIPADVDLAFIFNPKISATELLETICQELHIAIPAAASGKTLVDLLNRHLLASNSQGRKTVLVIDEAQNLTPEVLEQLRLLTNLETDKRKLLQIILLGQPELRHLISQPQLQQLAQRVTARYHLGTLDKHEISHYIFHRLQVAGATHMLFSPRAITLLKRYSKGVPRLLNLLCDRALLGAYAQNQQQVARAHIQQAAKEIFGRPEKRLFPPLLAGVSLTLLLGTATIFFLSGPMFEQQPPPAGSEPIAMQTSAPVQEAENNVKPAPAEPEEETTPPPLPTQWPQNFGFSTTQAEAFRDLARLWGLPLGAEGKADCDAVAGLYMQCYKRQAGIAELVRFNRPAILTLYQDDGLPFYVVLSALEEERGTFVAAGTERQLDIRALESRWFGEYLLLWQVPEPYTRPLMPGEGGSMNSWLAGQLSQLGFYHGSPDPQALTGQLLGALKRFQFAAGLTPDGILGSQSLILMNQAGHTGGPQLHPREEL